MNKPAIVVVGYNRPQGIRRLLESLGRASYTLTDITLIISIDESNLSDEVQKVADSFQWNHGIKIVRRFPQRQGLRKHIVQCGDYSKEFGAVIILEDDLIVSEDFYTYVCNAHEKYSEEINICGVSLYSFNTNPFTHFHFAPAPSIFDVYLGDMVVTWGQSWTWNQWSKFKKWYIEHDEKLPKQNQDIPRDISGWTRSWGRYFASYMAEFKLSYIYPYIARSTCFSDFGEHNKTRIPLTFVQVPLMVGSPQKYSFGHIRELIRYDCFYERVLDNNITISGITGDQICMDLNNMKTHSDGKSYVISNSSLPFQKIMSFGMTLKPICQNIIFSIPGNELHLYKIDNPGNLFRKWKGRRPKYYSSYKRLKYEYLDVSWRILLKYSPLEFLNRLYDILRTIFRR